MQIVFLTMEIKNWYLGTNRPWDFKWGWDVSLLNSLSEGGWGWLVWWRQGYSAALPLGHPLGVEDSLPWAKLVMATCSEHPLPNFSWAGIHLPLPSVWVRHPPPKTTPSPLQVWGAAAPLAPVVLAREMRRNAGPLPLSVFRLLFFC